MLTFVIHTIIYIIYTHPYYDVPIEEDGNTENRYIRIGFDISGNLLEIMYNEYDDVCCIFHVMKCRSIYLHLPENKEKIIGIITDKASIRIP